MGVDVRLAVEEDVGSIAARGIRLVDRIEANALGRGEDIEAAIHEGFGNSDCYVICDDDGPFVIGGITDNRDNPSIGIPWFISTDDITRHRFSFARIVRRLMDEADLKYDKMEQRMWVGNDKARAFAEAVGFSFDDENLSNMSGLDFVYFSRNKPGRA